MSLLLKVKNSQERKTRLFPGNHWFWALGHLPVWELWVPLPILWDCLKTTEWTIAPWKLFSQVKCPMRTGKARTSLKMMEGETSHITDLLWCGGRGGGWNLCRGDRGDGPWVDEGSSNIWWSESWTMPFRHVHLWSSSWCVLTFVGEQLKSSCF